MFNLCCKYFVLTIAILSQTIFAQAETSGCVVKIELSPERIIKFSNHEELCKCLGYDKYESKINSTKLDACVIETSDQEGKLGFSAESLCKCTGFKTDGIEETSTIDTVSDYFYGMNITTTDYITEEDINKNVSIASTISSVSPSDNRMISSETMTISTITAYETSTSTNNTPEKNEFTNSEYELLTTTTRTSKKHFLDETTTTDDNVSSIDYTTENLSTSTSEPVTISDSYFSIYQNLTLEIEKMKTLIDTLNSTDYFISDYDESTEIKEGTDINSTATDFLTNKAYFAINMSYGEIMNNSLESIHFNISEYEPSVATFLPSSKYSPDKMLSNIPVSMIDQTTENISSTFESLTDRSFRFPELSKWFEEDKSHIIFDTPNANETFMNNSDSTEKETYYKNYPIVNYTSYEKSQTQNSKLADIDFVNLGNEYSNFAVENNNRFSYPEPNFLDFENRIAYSNPFLRNKSEIASNTIEKTQINNDKSYDEITTVINNHDKYYKGFLSAKNNFTTSTVKYNELNNMNDKLMNPTLETYLTIYNHSNNEQTGMFPSHNSSFETFRNSYFWRAKFNATPRSTIRSKAEIEYYSKKNAAIENNKATSRSLYSTASQLFDKSFFKSEKDITSDDEDEGEGSGVGSKLNDIDDNNFEQDRNNNSEKYNYYESNYSDYNNQTLLYIKSDDDLYINTSDNTTEQSVNIYSTQNNPRNKPASVQSESDDSSIIPLIVILLGLCAIVILSLLLGAFLYTWCLKSGSYSLYSAAKANDNLELGSTYRRCRN